MDISVVQSAWRPSSHCHQQLRLSRDLYGDGFDFILLGAYEIWHRKS